MGDDITIRPMREDDVAAAWDAGKVAINAVFGFDDTGDPVARERGERRVAHLLATDPGGAWVAEDAQRGVVGVALALIRENVWGFSLFGLHPDFQGRRIGTRLFEPALAYGDATDGAIILSTHAPAAMHRYFNSGFRLIPVVGAAGALNANRIPDGLRSRPGDVEADAALIDEASRRARGASHRVDIPVLIESGCELLILEGVGYAVHRDGSPNLLAASDDASAADLLWSCFARAAPGATLDVDFLAEGNNWAMTVCVQAGLTLSCGAGPMFVRGSVKPRMPYIPSPQYL